MRRILVALTAAVLIGVGVPTATAHGDHVVEIQDGAFVPERVEIRVGETVRWKNEGETRHTVTADDGAFDSGPLGPGAEFEASFEEPGTHRFRSTAQNDEGMVGVVVVLPADNSDSSGSSGETDSGSDDRAAGGGSSGETGSSTDGSSEQEAAADSAPTDPSGSTQAEAAATLTLGGRPAVLAQAPAVAIQDDVFVPSRVQVDAGGTVVWQHAGQRPHTVTASDGSFDSGTLESGASFSQTFSQPGTFSYYCRFHGNPSGEGMAGVVVVRGAAAPGETDGEAPGAGEQTGGLAATGSQVVLPLGAAVVLIAAGLWAVRRSDPRRAARRR